MSEQAQVTELAAFDQEWLTEMERTPFARLVLGLVGLTGLGECPAALEQLAVIVERSAVETAALAQGVTSAHVDGDVIHWDEPFPGDRVRRMLYVGDRQAPMGMGCAPDLFGFAAVLDVPFRDDEHARASAESALSARPGAGRSRCRRCSNGRGSPITATTCAADPPGRTRLSVRPRCAGQTSVRRSLL